MSLVFVGQLPNRSNNSLILVCNKVSAAFLRFNSRSGSMEEQVNKCGSSTLQLLMKKLKGENRFDLYFIFLFALLRVDFQVRLILAQTKFSSKILSQLIFGLLSELKL